MDISYGILDYNPEADPTAQQYLEQCMRSLASNRSDRFASEVIVIGQGNRQVEHCNHVANLCRELGFDYLVLTDNVGISRGINKIAALARGDIISLLTSDVVISPGTDETLVADLDQNPNLYQVTPCVNKGTVRYQLAENHPGAGLQHCIANELTIQFWRREAFGEIGFWDERWKACYENNDWTMRLFIAGFDTAISFNTQCHHYHSTTCANGAIYSAYDGYLDMPGGLDHKVLRGMWNRKWPELDWQFMYNPGRLTEAARTDLKQRYEQNIYLPFIQEVSY